MLKTLLLLGLVAAVAVQANEQDAEHDADTPVRQAQRAMLAEREAATAKHATEDVLGMRLQAVSEGVEAEASAEAGAYPERFKPEARRISGAAQSFTPNDKMCVMCQFLAQRIQLDLVGGVGHLPYGGAAPYAGFGYPPTTMIAGVAPAGSFLETEEAEAEEDLVEVDENEEEAEAEEAEDEAEEEESDEAEAEEESEDQSFLQVAEEDEAEDEALIEVSADDAAAEWTTPTFADAEHGTALIEESADEADSFQTPQYIDAVYHTVEGEEAAEDTDSAEERDEAEAGTADSSEAVFFESSALVSRAAEEGEWTTPEFEAEAAAPKAETVPAELTALLQTGEEDGEDAWTTPAYSDAQAASTGNKEYARVLVAHDKEQSLIEASASETTEAAATVESEEARKKKGKKGGFRPRLVRSRGSRRGGKINRFRTKGADIFHTAKRYRSADAIVPRPRWNRLEHHSPRHMANRLIAGMALRNAEHAAYDRLEAYCSTRLPESYGKYCRPVLRKFRRITEGLSYGDRIPHVCMAVNLCKQTSYAVASVHDRLEERTF